MSALGLREKKKAATRRAIASVALELAIEHGPDGITVEAIADGAGVSARTVFNYFSTKDEAILGIDPDHRRELAAAALERPGDEDPLQALQHVLTAAVTQADDASNLWLARARLVHEHPQLRAVQVLSQNALEAELANAVARRTGLDVEGDPYPRLVAAAALTTLRRVLARSPDVGARRLRSELDRAFGTLANGLRPPAGTGR